MHASEIIAEINAALEKYKTDARLSSKLKLRIYDHGTIIAVEQNPNKNSFFALRQQKAEDVIQLLYKDKVNKHGIYVGVKIGNHVFLYHSALRKVFQIAPEQLTEFINTYDTYTVENVLGPYSVIGFKDENNRPLMVSVTNAHTKQNNVLYNIELIKEFLEQN